MRTVDLVGRQCAQESLMIALPFRTKISRAAVTAACVHDGVRLRASPRPVRSAGSFAATELYRRGKAKDDDERRRRRKRRSHGSPGRRCPCKARQQPPRAHAMGARQDSPATAPPPPGPGEPRRRRMGAGACIASTFSLNGRCVAPHLLRARILFGRVEFVAGGRVKCRERERPRLVVCLGAARFARSSLVAATCGRGHADALFRAVLS